MLGLTKKVFCSIVLNVAVLLCSGGLVQAAKIKPAVVYDLGGKYDKSFNQSVADGVANFAKDTGIKVRFFEPVNEAQIEQALRKFSQRGYNPVIAVSFTQAPALRRVAKEFPATQYTIIDSIVDLPNVRSVLFKEQEGSYLVGILAALASKTAKVGFVGGQDVGLVRKFLCGYKQGVASVDDSIVVFENMTGSTGAAWKNPGKGFELAKSQFDRGADVVFAAAGATSIGVYQAAKDNGKYAIGIDSNQNYLHPGTMLTSMLKRVDVAAYSTYHDAKNDRWSSGIQHLGLKESGVGWALDKYNKKIVSNAMKVRVEKARKRILSGQIKVHDYLQNNSCQPES